MTIQKFVAVFGSALRAGVTPRDLDVAFGGGVERAEAERLAQSWAEERGLSKLPLDLHNFSQPELPTPAGVPLAVEGLMGPVPTAREVRNLSALLRLGEFDPEQAKGEILHIARSDVEGEWLRIFVEGTNNPSDEDLQPYEGEGPVALQSALRHAPDGLLAQLGELGELLGDWKRDGGLTPAQMEKIRDQFTESTPNGERFGFVLRNDIWTVRTRFGRGALRRTELSIEEFRGLIAPVTRPCNCGFEGGMAPHEWTPFCG